jgi:hypothetical protein
LLKFLYEIRNIKCIAMLLRGASRASWAGALYDHQRNESPARVLIFENDQLKLIK